MSRSIHVTRQQLAKARLHDYADAATKETMVRRLRGALALKRRTKGQKRQEAAQAQQPEVWAMEKDGTPVPVGSVPIDIGCDGDPRYVHHAASPEDLRALLAVLPPGMANGMNRIVLTLGKWEMNGRRDADEGEADPLTGRLGWKVIPGVYAGNWLGMYQVKSATIWLYAYVYEAETLPLPLPACELFLRLRALTTFAHELAHHFDHSRRVARGRWLARGSNRVERYAEAREHAWGQKFVVPLLRKQYSEQVQALGEWIAHHGGVRVPLELLAGDPRTTRKDRLISLASDVGQAFRDWLNDSGWDRSDLLASRFAFAREMHLADQYDLCLQILDGLMKDWPPTAQVLSYKADTLVHLERWDEAEACARQALTMDSRLAEVWESLSWVAIGRHRWLEVLAGADTWLASLEADDAYERRNIMFHRAIACCGLGEFARMEECLAACVMRETYLKARRKAVYRWAGVPLPAEPLQS